MLLTTAFVFHVLSGALWTGATLYVVYATLPRATDGTLGRAAFVDAAHRLLMVTRWTGVVLPVTGAYMIWRLYTPLGTLATTGRGWAVLAMLSLWGAMNGLVELGVLRMRREVDPDLGWGRYMAEGFPVDALAGVGGVPGSARLASVARPYLLASAGLAVLLLVDAALLAGGIPG
ncbi:copper resistance protein CopD [Halorubrum sp. Atlit-8R]|uniref:copper resistance protein CopD n=1 Tax=unclassified Halorubrum TaxID=2642239 RepID=UPI000EF1D4B6|nr:MULTISPECIES: copper resistance protein CopD [unclassified Halorubrum]RLM71501.1 copper resistance protein CopD [Halorubrum sp. Atlit-9R]RLM82344.1 copper resistance protein CopD [Halorubrum sp. Atlit-8R]